MREEKGTATKRRLAHGACHPPTHPPPPPKKRWRQPRAAFPVWNGPAFTCHNTTHHYYLHAPPARFPFTVPRTLPAARGREMRTKWSNQAHVKATAARDLGLAPRRRVVQGIEHPGVGKEFGLQRRELGRCVERVAVGLSARWRRRRREKGGGEAGISTKSRQTNRLTTLLFGAGTELRAVRNTRTARVNAWHENVRTS